MKRPFLLLVLTLFFQYALMANNWTNIIADTISAETDSLVHNQCFGDSDGKIFLLVQSALPVTYAWSNGDSLQNIDGLAAGLYSVTISDTTGSQFVLDSIFIEQPGQIELGFSNAVLPDCNGSFGSLALEVAGGTPSYTYLWNNGDTLAVADSLVAGLYEVSVTDANGCTATASFDLLPHYPTVSLTSSGNINCLQPVVSLESSTALQVNETFSWLAENGGHFSTGTDTLSVMVDSAGTYTLTILDTLTGCASSAFVIVALDTLAPSVNAGPDTAVVCANSVVGLIGTATNGPSFDYNWTASNGGLILDGATTDSITVTAAGLFTFHVTNLENGCSSVDTVEVIGSNPVPTATLMDGELNCYFPTINLNAVADTTDKVFEWNGPNGFISNELSPSVNEGGNYVLTIVDTVTTCSANFSLEVITNSDSPLLTVSGGILSCTATSVTLSEMTTSGNAGYAWTGPNGFASAEQNPSVSDAGEYILSLTDTLNGCSSIDTAFVTVDTLAPTLVIAQAGILTCLTPTLSLDASGSTLGNILITWTTLDGNILSGAETPTPVIDAVGTYGLTLTDTLNGCSETGLITVEGDFVTPTVDAIGGTFTCFDGGVFILGQLDTSAVSFGWAGPGGYVSNEQNPFVTAAGDYVLTVTNLANGCAVSDTAAVGQIGEIPLLTVAVSDTITCDTTSVQLSVSAQIGGIDWSWSGPNGFASTDQNPNTDQSGWYFVLAIDTVNGCIALDSVFVEMNTEYPLADAGNGLAFDCHTTSTILNGSATTGAGFEFDWNTQDGHFAAGENTLNPTVDLAGTYTLTVTNLLNGCVSTSEVVISQTPPVVVEVNSTDVICHGEANGTGTVLASGGVGGYSIAWSSGSTGTTATGLVVGNYTVTATDADGCSAEGNIVVNQPDLLTTNASAIGQSLSGIDDGSAMANPSGGSAPYTYTWSNSETDQAIIGLAPGAYSVIVADANGCNAIETVNVNEFPCVLSSSISGIHVDCSGDSTGSATVVLENAILPYTFEWSNGDTTATASNLTEGIYTVTLHDSTLCENILTIAITQPTPLVLTELFHENLDCPDEENGFVVVGANGGVQPYAYLWTNGSTSAVSKDLGAGLAELVLTDANGCEASFSTTIVAEDSLSPQLVLQNITLALDENGAVSLSANLLDAGTTDNCGTFSLTAVPDTFDCSNLGTQSVTVTAVDGSGNTSIGAVSVEIIDNQAPVLTCPSNKVASECNPTVTFNSPDVADNCAADLANLVQTEGLPSGSMFGLGSTSMVFVYTDAGGNSASCTFEVTVVESMQIAGQSTNLTCAAECTGLAEMTVLSGGSAPFQFVWSNGEQVAALSGLCSGTYTATVTDATGCEVVKSVVITEPSALELTVVAIENNECANDLNGSITTNLMGGTAPYFYAWSDGSSDGNLSDAASGIYTLVATDAAGCVVSLTSEITAQDQTPPTLLLQNMTVSLDNNGFVTFDAVFFDNGSFDNCSIVSWDISPNSFDCSSVGNQVVTITATDNNGNSSSGTAMVTIEDKTDPVLLCPANKVVGFCNPQVIFSTPQITDNCEIVPGNLQQVSGLPSGANFPFGLTIQQFGYHDAAGNATTCSFTVTVHSPAVVSATVDDVACNSVCDGQATLELTGNASPFTVAWSNGQTGLSATGLCSGDYNATIVDSDGCLQFFSTLIMEPSSLEVTVDGFVNDSNMDGVGAIQITVSGGVTPYTYEWTKDGLPFSNNEDLTGLFAGTYQVIIFDANGCEIESGAVVVQDLVPAKETDLSDAFKLAPNPATQWTTLAVNQVFMENTSIDLYDAVGKLARRYPAVKGQSEVLLDLDGIPSGFYTVKISMDNGLVVKTLVVE